MLLDSLIKCSQVELWKGDILSGTNSIPAIPALWGKNRDTKYRDGHKKCMCMCEHPEGILVKNELDSRGMHQFTKSVPLSRPV